MIRRVVAEGVGTAFLLAAIVGSGIMGARLAGGNVALALLANAIATGAALTALILAFGPISGAHFNPVVSVTDAVQGGLLWREVPAYCAAQFAGAIVGVWTAHAMFAEPILQLSRAQRAGTSQMFSEFVATMGLLIVIWGCTRRRLDATPYAVGLYITGAYWFTASTSFANPAVTLARSFTNTFAGIRLGDAPAFVVAEVAGGFAGALLLWWLAPPSSAEAREVLMPREEVAVHE